MSGLNSRIIVMATFGRKLRKLCGVHRISPKELAETLGDISKSSIYDWCNDTSIPNVVAAARIARYFRTSLDYLADDTLESPPAPELTEDEARILWLVRAQGRSADDVARALDLYASETARDLPPLQRPVPHGPVAAAVRDRGGPAGTTGVRAAAHPRAATEEAPAVSGPAFAPAIRHRDSLPAVEAQFRAADEARRPKRTGKGKDHQPASSPEKEKS